MSINFHEESIRRQLDNLGEISKNGRNVFLLLVFVISYATISSLSIRIPDEYDRLQDEVWNIFSELEEQTDFKLAYDRAIYENATNTFYSSFLFLIHNFFEIDKRNFIGIHGRKIIDDTFIYLKGDLLPFKEYCSSFNEKICLLRSKFMDLRRIASDVGSAEIKVDASPLKGEFSALLFLQISIFVVGSLFAYFLYICVQFSQRSTHLEQEIEFKLMKYLNYPWLFGFFRYGNLLEKLAFMTICFGIPSIFLLYASITHIFVDFYQLDGTFSFFSIFFQISFFLSMAPLGVIIYSELEDILVEIPFYKQKITVLTFFWIFILFVSMFIFMNMHLF